MRYRILGGTGIEVSVQCLGAMMFGAVGNPDQDDCARIIHAALAGGINFVDTADTYGAGESEGIVGKALQGRRDDVVLATKVHFPLGEGRNRSGNSRRWIVAEVEHSLRRLRTDWIDLYQVHRPDHSTDIEETLWVLTDLVQQGKVRAFGRAPPFDDVFGWVSRACNGRLTMPQLIRAARLSRGRMRWRAELEVALSDIADGVMSALENRWVRDVERAHGLPAAERQVPVTRAGGLHYLDNLHRELRIGVELDGRVYQPADERWRDIGRDNAWPPTGY
jgi:predicted oxidoreductase